VQTWVREALADAGAYHSSINGVVTFPDSPPENGKYNKRRMVFHYGEPLTASSYNAQVSQGLATVLQAKLQTISSDELPFPVLDGMLDVNLLVKEVVEVASYTKRLWTKAEKASSTERAMENRRQQRHYARKDRVRLSLCGLSLSLTVFLADCASGQACHEVL
jgi:hypothetical protein